MVSLAARTHMSASEELAELQSFSRHLLTQLDESRSMGQFGQAEIELLRKKLSVVVNAFSAERQKIEGELSTVRPRLGRAAVRVGENFRPPSHLFFPLLHPKRRFKKYWTPPAVALSCLFHEPVFISWYICRLFS